MPLYCTPENGYDGKFNHDKKKKIKIQSAASQIYR